PRAAGHSAGDGERGGGRRAAQRSVRCQGRRRDGDVRRVARDCQCGARRGRCAHYIAAPESRGGFRGHAKTMRRAVQFTLNGERVEAQVAPHETLVEVLREAFGLYGARESCGQGLCGCCTVLVNGTAVSGCLYLATLAEGAHVETVEAGETLD